jgi:dimethylamine monooxygenase subunit A
VTPRAPEWLTELTLRTEAPWLPMGARALHGAPMFQAEGPDVDRLRERKRELLATAHREVSVELPDFGAPVRDAAHYVARVTGRTLEAGRPVLEAAALTVAEDLVVLARIEGVWRMAAGVVCFPSHWLPASKLGQPVAGIHEPVPGYADELSDRVDRFLDRLKPERPAWRRNWTVHASPELHAPWPVAVAAPVAPEDHWLRSERQTLTLLPLTGAILFAIRTEQVPLASLRDQPGTAGELAAAIRSTPADLGRYRFGSVDIDGVSRWLERSSASRAVASA